jgi:hypothetical protein
MTQIPLIQALKGFIAYALYQLDANLCCNGIFSHCPRFCPEFAQRCVNRSPGMDAGGNAANKTAGVQPAVFLVRFDI